MSTYAIPSENFPWYSYTPNLVIPGTFFQKLLSGQACFGPILTVFGPNDLEGQGQISPYAIHSDILPRYTYKPNLVILGAFFQKLLCVQANVDGQTDGRTDGQTQAMTIPLGHTGWGVKNDTVAASPHAGLVWMRLKCWEKVLQFDVGSTWSLRNYVRLMSIKYQDVITLCFFPCDCFILSF